MNNLVKIEDTDIVLIDGDRGIHYPSKNEFYDKEYCLFLDARNITDKGFDFSETHFITKEKDEILRNGKLRRNDIVMMTRGSVGNVALYDEAVFYDNIRINSGMIIIRCKNEYDSIQVYYLLKSNFVKKQISDMMSGSVQKQLPVSTINKIKLPRIKINIDIIYAIDKKIENNNRINEELESMAKTIYDYWFLQFEFPNEDGNPYKSSGGKMVWNKELKREIPDGWKCIQLSEIFSFVKGKIPEKLVNEQKEGLYPYITIEVANDEKTQYCSGKNMVYCNGEVIMVMDGAASGDVYIGNEGILGSTFAMMKRKRTDISNALIYSILNWQSVIYKKANTGSTVPHANRKFIETIKIPISEDMKKFSNIFNEIFGKIIKNRKENQELISLRDFLLPLLMNGQVGFKE